VTTDGRFRIELGRTITKTDPQIDFAEVSKQLLIPGSKSPASAVHPRLPSGTPPLAVEYTGTKRSSHITRRKRNQNTKTSHLSRRLYDACSIKKKLAYIKRGGKLAVNGFVMTL
jgi:hypothetical protein